MRYSENDKVRFWARGHKLVGIIKRIRIKRRQGKARALAQLVTGDSSSLDTEVAEIVPDGGGSIWTVSLSGIIERVAAAAPAERQAATETVHRIKRANRDHRDKINGSNYDALQVSGLWQLHCSERGGIGAAIEIKFSDIGWAPATFEGLISSSLNVRYKRGGRMRTTAAANARIAQPAAAPKIKT